jgi:hypothetical protein
MNSEVVLQIHNTVSCTKTLDFHNNVSWHNYAAGKSKTYMDLSINCPMLQLNKSMFVGLQSSFN